MNKPKKVALAYSGGLDTSVIIPWLKENYGCEVVAVCGDIGQGDEELAGLEEKARKTGASEVHVADMREEFVSQYLWKMVRSGGVYEHKYLLGTSIARPLLAKKQVEVANTRANTTSRFLHPPRRSTRATATSGTSRTKGERSRIRPIGRRMTSGCSLRAQRRRRIHRAR